MLGRHTQALDAYEAALTFDPDRPETYYGQGLALHALGRHEEAASCHERALIIDPDYAEASCALGAAHVALKRPWRALAPYRQALDVDPDYVEALCGLAEALHAERKLDEAIALYHRAAVLRPDARVLTALGVALTAAERHQDAIETLRAAVAADPADGAARLHLGTALSEIGNLSEAVAQYEAAVAIDPGDPGHVFALIGAAPVAQDGAAFTALTALAARLDTLTPPQRVLVHFGLGKALTDLGRPAEAFAALAQGNALKRATLVYDEAGTRRALQGVASVFTPAFIGAHRGFGDVSDLPVFIVGLPRSGSTLVEQVLASHPAVHGGGERPDFVAAMAAAGIDPAAPDFAERCAAIDGPVLATVATGYLARLGRAVGYAGQKRITDKMLANYCFVGLIHLALPNAKIIHIRRDPVDCALSCYSKLFAAEVPFAYDLGEFGRYHAGYRGLIAHWHDVLPPDTLLDVDYEALVADFEPQARRIVGYCGLAWDDACARFYETERAVRTASVTQVRQPIYRSSVGRWRPDEATLGPLMEGLNRSDRRTVRATV